MNLLTYKIIGLLPDDKEIPADKLCWKSKEGLFRVAQKLVGANQFEVVMWNPVDMIWHIEKTYEDVSEAINKGERLEKEWIKFARMMDKTAESLGLSGILFNKDY